MPCHSVLIRASRNSAGCGQGLPFGQHSDVNQTIEGGLRICLESLSLSGIG